MSTSKPPPETSVNDHTPGLEKEDWENDSVLSDLSDLDEEQFINFNDGVGGGGAAADDSSPKEVIPIDEDTVGTIGKYKKKSSSSGSKPTEVTEPPKGRRRRRDKSSRDDDDDEVADNPVVEIELTEEESRFSFLILSVFLLNLY